MYNDTIEMFLSDLRRNGVKQLPFKSDLLKVIQAADGDPFNNNGTYNRLVYPTRLYNKQSGIYCRFLEFLNQRYERRDF